jgi:hypothetical protein
MWEATASFKYKCFRHNLCIIWKTDIKRAPPFDCERQGAVLLNAKFTLITAAYCREHLIDGFVYLLVIPVCANVFSMALK